MCLSHLWFNPCYSGLKHTLIAVSPGLTYYDVV